MTPVQPREPADDARLSDSRATAAGLQFRTRRRVRSVSDVRYPGFDRVWPPRRNLRRCR
ncbi:unnamed protein product, partial [marine sediment metagenome]